MGVDFGDRHSPCFDMDQHRALVRVGPLTLGITGAAMNLDVVRNFLSLPTDKRAWGKEGWSVIRDPSAFLSIDWGEETEEIVLAWNRIAGSDLTVVAEILDFEGLAGYTHKLTLGERTLYVPYVGSREDCFIAVLTLNQLVEATVDMRFCQDSVGNSDLCFLPLLPTHWSDFEAEFGKEMIDRRFRKLPRNFEDFEAYLL